MCARTAPTRACCHVRVNCSGGCDVALAAATDGKTKSRDTPTKIIFLENWRLNWRTDIEIKLINCVRER